MEKTKIVGVTFDGRQKIIKDINEMTDTLVPTREPDNPYDPNAINIFVKKADGTMKSVGYINRHLAKELSPKIDAGQEMLIHNYFVIGGKSFNEDNPLYGVVIGYELV